MPAHQRRFAELRADEVATACSARSLLLLPIGALEQHGPHLPLATDSIIAEAAVAAVVARCGEALDLWTLPPLRYSKSNEHAWAAGTVSLSVSTLLSLLDDIGRAVAATPIRRLVFVNGHGGNSALLAVACRELRLRYGLLTFLVPPYLPADHGGTGDAGEGGQGVHAGVDETSVLLHLRPDLVDMSKARRNVPEAIAAHRHVRFGGSVVFGWLSDDFGPDGVIGDPTAATAERGRRSFEAVVATLAEQLAEIAAFEFPVRSR